MTSWRDNASPEDQAELDELLSAAVPFALQVLEEHGEFYPYAAVVDGTGELTLVAAQSEVDFPDSEAVIANLLDVLRDRATEIRASALVADVRHEGGDAVRAEMEHRAGHAMTVVLPYSGGAGQAVELGEPWAVSGPKQVWSPQ